MATQGRSSSTTRPPELFLAAKVGGRGQVITWDDQAPVEVALRVVSGPDGEPNASAELVLEMDSKGPAVEALIEQLAGFIAELRRRPNERVALQIDFEKLLNG